MGQTASFSVSASGTEPLSYFCQFNGTGLVGSTNSSLTLTNVQLDQAGSYQVVVINDYGSKTSSSARLAVADKVLLKASAALELEFTTQTNTTYYIQASPDQSFWTNFEGPISGNGLDWSKLYSTPADGPLYYRLWWVP